ncbi:hypothetical protein [Scytonema sp. PCC 10023]|uniref:hypothetical protein n=1 Tax=Scytonema sp. PCC 10023 TaxID=1680591 RepID=UPI0039C615B1
MDIAELTAALKELRNEALSELTRHRDTTKDIWDFSAEILEVIEKWYAMGHQVIVEAFPTIHLEIEFTHKQAHQILRNYRTLTEGLLTEFKKAMELAAQNY